MQSSEKDVDVLETGVAHGCKIKVVQTPMGHFCGYVQTNFRPPWDYDTIRGGYGSLVDCHGGLTYGTDAEGWIGFDCAHAGDVCIRDGEKVSDHEMRRCKEWTVDDVAAECRSVARQVETLQEFAEKFDDIGWGGE